MALTDENGGIPATMLVGPTGYGGGNGFFGGNGDLSWLILLFLICGGGFGMGMGGMMPWMMGAGMGGFGGWEFPWLWAGQNNINDNVNSGFRDQMLQTSVTSIGDKVSSGFGDVALGIAGLNQNICQTGNGITASITGAQTAIAQQLYNNEIGSLNRSFAEQTANAQGFSGIAAQLSQCCCDNRLATVQTQNIVQSEGAQTRAAIQAQTQAILDKMCQQEIDNLKAQNIALQNQVNMQNLAASQAAQTAALVADNTAQTQYIVNRVAPYPIPAYTVANPITPAAAALAR